MKIETERLIIIPCTEETVKMTVDQHYNNGPHIANFLKELSVDSSLLYWGSWLVLLKENHVIIGDIGFKGKPTEEDGVVEVGYGLLEEYWHRGFATEAVGALIRWAFDTSKVDKVIAETLIENNSSIRVLEKLKLTLTAKTENMFKWELVKNR